MKNFHFLLSFIFLISLPVSSEAQFLEKTLEFLTIHPNKKAVAKDSTLYPAKAIFTPVVENKYLFFSSFDIFFPQERYVLTGFVNIQSFPSLFFGIGEDTPKSNEEKFSYGQILMEPILLKKVLWSHFFLGGGFRYNRVSGFEKEPDGLLANLENPGSDGSTSSGFQGALQYDSRDNILNAKKGIFIRLTHGFYEKFLGSSENFELTRFDARYYKQFKKTPAVFAFQFFAQFGHGEIPFLELGRMGGSYLMRGYFKGRYTDRHMIATQVEWRQKLTHRWGAVVFAGVGSVSSTIGEFKNSSLRPSVGVGIRFLVDEEEDLNVRLDYGIGQEKKNFYFNIAEAF